MEFLPFRHRRRRDEESSLFLFTEDKEETTDKCNTVGLDLARYVRVQDL